MLLIIHKLFSFIPSIHVQLHKQSICVTSSYRSSSTEDEVFFLISASKFRTPNGEQTRDKPISSV
jgi:hypothetical protein